MALEGFLWGPRGARPLNCSTIGCFQGLKRLDKIIHENIGTYYAGMPQIQVFGTKMSEFQMSRVRHYLKKKQCKFYYLRCFFPLWEV